MTVEYDPKLAYLSKGFANHTVVGFDKDQTTGIQAHPKRRFDYSVMFGGRNEEGLIRPDLIKTKISRNKASYEVVETLGSPPTARYNHSMTYLQKPNIICVFGGQGEDVETSVLADHMSIIHMVTLQWHTCKIKRNTEVFFESRYCHGAVAFKDSIILFGGINSTGFADSSIDIIKIEEMYSAESMEEEVAIEEPVQQEPSKKIKKLHSSEQVSEPYVAQFQPRPPSTKNLAQYKTSLQPIPTDNYPIFTPVSHMPQKTGSQWSRIMYHSVTPKVQSPSLSPSKQIPRRPIPHAHLQT